MSLAVLARKSKATNPRYNKNRGGVMYQQSEMRDWEDLFYLLQCLNPESDKPSPHCLDEPEDTERWEDICYYMDRLKPKEEK